MEEAEEEEEAGKITGKQRPRKKNKVAPFPPPPPPVWKEEEEECFFHCSEIYGRGRMRQKEKEKRGFVWRPWAKEEAGGGMKRNSTFASLLSATLGGSSQMLQQKWDGTEKKALPLPPMPLDSFSMATLLPFFYRADAGKCLFDVAPLSAKKNALLPFFSCRSAPPSARRVPCCAWASTESG